VQQSTHPNANNTSEIGNPIIIHKQAVNIAPVSLKPSQSKNPIQTIANINPIIFFTPFTLLKTLYFPRLSVSLGMIKVYNGVAKEYISKSAH